MPHITGVLDIERVIRPTAVEELLCLKPANGSKAIIFDLEVAMQRAGLCEFIKECAAFKTPLMLESNGGLAIPPAMENRFEFYHEFYGLTRWALVNIEILKSSEDKKEGKSESKGGTKAEGQTEKKENGGKKESGEENRSMKKLDAPPPPAAKPKPKISKKLDPKMLNTIPASIVWIAGGSVKEVGGPKKAAPTGPLALSVKLGGHKVGLSKFGLGAPSAGLKSLGGPSR